MSGSLLKFAGSPNSLVDDLFGTPGIRLENAATAVAWVPFGFILDEFPVGLTSIQSLRRVELGRNISGSS